MSGDNLTKQIFRIAVPSIVGFVGLTIFEVIDIFWIGKLNSKAVAAAGACAFVEWMLYAIMNLTHVGCATLVSQHIGAKKKDEKYDVIREAVFFSLVIGLIITFSVFPFMEIIFSSMGLDAVTVDYAVKYFSILLAGFPILYIFALQGRIFNAYGDTKSSTITMLIALLLNLVLDPCLIFGWWIFPELGIKGASLASMISMILGVILRIIILRRYDYIAPLKTFFKFSTEYLKPLLKIGLPSCTTNMIWSAVYPMLTVVVTKFGMAPLAALNVCHRIEGIPYFVSVGFNIAMSTLVGQYYGAKEYDKVGRIVKRGSLIIAATLTPVALAFVFIPEHIVGLLNDDPEILKHGAEYLRIVGYCEIFMGLEVALEGAFNGLGNTKPYMLIRAPLTLIRVPLAWLFAITLGFGTVGIWWAISITTAVKGILMAVSFVSNKRNRELLTV